MEILKEIDDYIKKEYAVESFFEFYPFSNEMIFAYLPLFDLKKKSLLTVGSSSDQAINASFRGCEDITILDICPLAKYYYYLKLASLLQLDREEFLRFLCKWNPGGGYNYSVYNKDSFERIKRLLKEMDYDSYEVWDTLFKKYSLSELDWLIRTDILSRERIVNYNEYLYTDENYLKTRKKMENTSVKLIEGDIIKKNWNQQYDNIWLSNITDYLKDNQIKKLLEKVVRSLTPEGKALVQYNILDEMRKIIATGERLQRIPLLERDGNDSRSSVVIYQKTRIH